jgi:SAM-dependent methyltransferase
VEFDRFRDNYEDELEDAIAFAGADAGLYTEVKADAVVDLARRTLGDPDRLRVLDAGCGPGETDACLRGRFAELVGADISEGMVEVAAERNPWASYRHFHEGESLPFEDDRFDLSFAICVLHHVEPPLRPGFLGELARVTRPGGVVAVFEHNRVNPGTRKVVRDCKFDEGVTLLPIRETLSLLDGQSLIPVERRHILFFPWRGRALRSLERGLARVPLGAQYYAAGRVPFAPL